VTNRSLNALAARRETATLEDYEIAGVDDLSDASERLERLRAVTSGLLMLAPEPRALLVLHELEGLSYAQVAQVLDIAPAAVKGRVHRARVALATIVGGDW